MHFGFMHFNLPFIGITAILSTASITLNFFPSFPILCLSSQLISVYVLFDISLKQIYLSYFTHNGMSNGLLDGASRYLLISAS